MNLKEYKTKKMNDPEFAKAYEEIQPEMNVIRAIIDASANATLIACLDRLFYSTHFDKTMKVGASVVVARRGDALLHMMS